MDDRGWNMKRLLAILLALSLALTMVACGKDKDDDDDSDKSSKKKTAFVSEYGIIYAREKGSAVISAKVNGKAVKIKLTVTE